MKKVSNLLTIAAAMCCSFSSAVLGDSASSSSVLVPAPVDGGSSIQGMTTGQIESLRTVKEILDGIKSENLDENGIHIHDAIYVLRLVQECAKGTISLGDKVEIEIKLSDYPATNNDLDIKVSIDKALPSSSWLLHFCKKVESKLSDIVHKRESEIKNAQDLDICIRELPVAMDSVNIIARYVAPRITELELDSYYMLCAWSGWDRSKLAEIQSDIQKKVNLLPDSSWRTLTNYQNNAHLKEPFNYKSDINSILEVAQSVISSSTLSRYVDFGGMRIFRWASNPILDQAQNRRYLGSAMIRSKVVSHCYASVEIVSSNR